MPYDGNVQIAGGGVHFRRPFVMGYQVGGCRNAGDSSDQLCAATGGFQVLAVECDRHFDDGQTFGFVVVMGGAGDDVRAIGIHELFPCYQVVIADIPERNSNPFTVGQDGVFQVAIEDAFNLFGALVFVGIAAQLSDRSLERPDVVVDPLYGSLY